MLTGRKCSDTAHATSNNKRDEKNMATLKDLCSAIPQQVLQEQARYDRQQTMREVARRQAASYQKRVDSLREERDVFGHCQTRRPCKGKAKNRASSEAAGTMGTQMTTRRFSGSYITVYCKSRKQY